MVYDASPLAAAGIARQAGRGVRFSRRSGIRNRGTGSQQLRVSCQEKGSVFHGLARSRGHRASGLCRRDVPMSPATWSVAELRRPARCRIRPPSRDSRYWPSPDRSIGRPRPAIRATPVLSSKALVACIRPFTGPAVRRDRRQRLFDPATETTGVKSRPQGRRQCATGVRKARQVPDFVGFRAASPPIDTYIDPSRSQRMTRSRVIDERRAIGITNVTVRSSLRICGVLPGFAITTVAASILVKESERAAVLPYRPSQSARHRSIGVCSSSATKYHCGPSSGPCCNT
jgi:hypothetical protein